MRRLLALLIVLALSVSNGAGLAAAICQHQDVRAHATALHSADRSVAAAAASEDTAAAATKRTGALADPGAASLAGFFLPPDGVAIPIPLEEATNKAAARVVRLSGRSLRPLIRPPLA